VNFSKSAVAAMGFYCWR